MRIKQVMTIENAPKALKRLYKESIVKNLQKQFNYIFTCKIDECSWPGNT